MTQLELPFPPPIFKCLVDCKPEEIKDGMRVVYGQDHKEPGTIRRWGGRSPPMFVIVWNNTNRTTLPFKLSQCRFIFVEL